MQWFRPNRSWISSFARERPNRNYDDARRADIHAYAEYYRAMLERGVLLPPSQNEVMFVSTAHAERDIDETLAAIDEYFAMCGGSPIL